MHLSFGPLKKPWSEIPSKRYANHKAGRPLFLSGRPAFLIVSPHIVLISENAILVDEGSIKSDQRKLNPFFMMEVSTSPILHIERILLGGDTSWRFFAMSLRVCGGSKYISHILNSRMGNTPFTVASIVKATRRPLANELSIDTIPTRSGTIPPFKQ